MACSSPLIDEKQEIRDRAPLQSGKGPHPFFLLLFLFVFAVFLRSSSPSVSSGDSGELLAASWCLGVPHPPGYPLWVVWSKSCYLLPVGSMELRASAGSAFLGSLACLFAAMAATRLAASRWAGALVGLACVSCEGLWSQFSIAEVYALNAALAGGLLWTVMRTEYRRQDLLKAALLLGLGMSNHHTFLLVAAPLGVGMLAGLPRFRGRIPLLAKGSALGLLGLSPYIAMAIRSNRTPSVNWGVPDTFSRFLTHLSRSQYGMPWGEESLHASLPQRLSTFTAECGDQWGWAPLLFVLLGAGFLVTKSKRIGLAVLATALIGGPVLSILVVPNFDAEAVDTVSVFYLPAFLILALLVGLGLHRIVLAWGRRWIAPSLILLLLLMLRNSSLLQRRVDWIAHDHGRDLLLTAGRQGVLLAATDDQRFPVAFLQSAEQRAPGTVCRYVGEDPYAPLLNSPLSALSQSELLERKRKFLNEMLVEERTVTWMSHALPVELEDRRWAPYGLGYRSQPLHMPTQCADRLWDLYMATDSVPVDLGDRLILHDYGIFQGVALMEQGLFWRGIDRMEKALNLVKGAQSPPNTVGCILARREEVKLAVSFFEQALTYDRKYVPARLNLGRALLDLGRNNEGSVEIRKVLQLEPRNVAALNELARAYAAAGQYEDALSAWRVSLSIEPDQREVRAMVDRLSETSR